MNDLTGKFAIITGGANGIGAATARCFAVEGASGIIIADLDYAGATRTINEIKNRTNCKCKFVKTNIGERKNIERLFKKTLDTFKGLDILVNCAGISNKMTIEEIDEKQWDNVMSINLKGTYLCSREALKIMKNQRSGKIINVSSISGRIGGIAAGIDYCTSKGGIITLTKTLAKYAGSYNINVNAIAPGYIETEMAKLFNHFNSEEVPLKRIGKPEDVANVIVFLASEKSSYVTGETIDINGGLFMT
jgi:NAD(P)-dependent dehydrogenase (short-subunit alcohol dehydrogenase family)